MTKVHIETNGGDSFSGDGSQKIFGMENFGNTCYCNSILQCLFYSDSFRNNLINYRKLKRDRLLEVNGLRPHNFTTKYEQLVEKKRKEQAKDSSVTNGDKARKGSIFGLNFKSYSTNNVQLDENRMANYVSAAEHCVALTMEQRIKISKSAHFQKLSILVTRPGTKDHVNGGDRSDFSQSSSMLLSDSPENHVSEGSVLLTSSAIIVGIPNPEPFLVQPINPFSLNPSSDQRKRSALINGPIINLDSALTEAKEDTVILYALKDMFESMIENKSTIGVVSPSYFIAKLKEKNCLFRQNNMHHDAHEFFNYLLNEIIEVLNKDLGPDNNWCNDIFQGMITNETKCLNCETVTSKHEYFLDLSVDVPPGESAYSLSHSLNNFSKLEVLTNQNKFYCNSCLSLQEAVKTIKLKKLPEVLVINFKRFKYDDKVDKLVKLFDSISYPFKLRLLNTTDDESDFSLYELYGLVIHIGGGPTHGHYVALCKVKPGLWLLFDDETVELVEDSYVMRFFGNGPGMASAYILFYNKIKKTALDQEFGFSSDAIYDGNDYTVFEKLNSSQNTIKKTLKLDESDPLASETSSIHSNGEIPTKKGLFKNFKFDSGNGNHNLNGYNNSLATSANNQSTSTIVPSSNNSTTNGDKTISSVTSKEKEVKKTWVGGLMRRESTQTISSERKSSVGSNERRKSIFSFKRKEKKEN